MFINPWRPRAAVMNDTTEPDAEPPAAALIAKIAAAEDAVAVAQAQYDMAEATDQTAAASAKNKLLETQDHLDRLKAKQRGQARLDEERRIRERKAEERRADLELRASLLRLEKAIPGAVQGISNYSTGCAELMLAYDGVQHALQRNPRIPRGRSTGLPMTLIAAEIVRVAQIDPGKLDARGLPPGANVAMLGSVNLGAIVPLAAQFEGFIKTVRADLDKAENNRGTKW